MLHTVINVFSEHITINRKLSIDIWQHKCQQQQTKNFRGQSKNNVVIYQLPNEYGGSWIACIIMPEYLKYCIQLTEYWLNISAYLNIA